MSTEQSAKPKPRSNRAILCWIAYFVFWLGLATWLNWDAPSRPQWPEIVQR